MTDAQFMHYNLLELMYMYTSLMARKMTTDVKHHHVTLQVHQQGSHANIYSIVRLNIVADNIEKYMCL